MFHHKNESRCTDYGSLFQYVETSSKRQDWCAGNETEKYEIEGKKSDLPILWLYRRASSRKLIYKTYVESPKKILNGLVFVVIYA